MKAIVLGLILDLLIGDPYFLPHPVKLMGNIINFEEKIARKISTKGKFLKFAGLIIVLINIFLGFLIPSLILKYSNGLFNEIIKVYFVYTCVSARMLHYEAFKVRDCLKESLEKGRDRLKYIVGRDTSELSEKEVVAATVETVSENTSDGVIAPLFYILIFGISFGFVYKFINTMDSMIAYKNEKYEKLGYFPAIVDDIANFIPARITGYLMAISLFFKYDAKRSLRTIKRDHKKHLSPNAGYPESAVAGLLGIQLGGGHNYFGKFVYKPHIGQKYREISIKDIDRSVFIMYISSFVFAILGMGLVFIINLLKGWRDETRWRFT